MTNMIEIDLTKYTVEELLDLNEQVVSRIKEVRKNQVAEQVKKFKMGDIVSFDQEGKTIYSMVLKISRNKVTVLAENRKRYTVHAMALTLEEDKDKRIETKILAIINKEMDKAMKGAKIIK